MRGECAHCGLPLGRRPTRGTVDGEALCFCCFGCLLAMQVSRARGDAGHASATLVRLGLAVFFTMNVMMVSMPSYVPQVYGDELGPTDGPLFQSLRWLGAIFSVPVLALLGWPIAASAGRGLRSGAANADALLALAVIAAYGLSAYNVLLGRPQVYFETGAMLLVLVTLGRYLEARARAEAGAAVRAHLAPAPAYAVRLEGERRCEVEPASLAPGDIVAVAPGAALPTDGIVVAGCASVDESALTGESWPVVKQPGAAVAGGTCCIDGVLTVRVTAPAAASAAARIEALLAAARRDRSPIERLADRLAGVLVPLVAAIALAAGIRWTAVAGLDRGVLAAVAVLVVACPCGLGIATPAAVWIGLATAAQRGAIVRSAAALERLADVGRVLLDKTGTLTDRLPKVVSVDVVPGRASGARELLARAAALEVGLHHPLARAVLRAAAEMGLAARAARDVRAEPGRGVRGCVDGERVAIGSERFVAAELAAADAVVDVRGGLPPPPADTATAYVAAGGRLLGAIRFAEALDPNSREAMAELRAQGVSLGLVSGDVQAPGAVRELLGDAEVCLGLSPEEKAARVRAERSAYAAGAVAMVGDGINDAIALAAADVGIAVADATDLARTTADVVVLSRDLRAVPWLVAHARRVRRVAWQNLAWAFAYNAVAVALAAAGRLNPLVASLAMIASSAVVVANARRLAAPRAPALGAPATSAPVQGAATPFVLDGPAQPVAVAEL